MTLLCVVADWTEGGMGWGEGKNSKTILWVIVDFFNFHGVLNLHLTCNSG